MCSIVMPTDYEMVVAHSPPIFSHSPPTSFLTRYDSFPAPTAPRMTRLIKKQTSQKWNPTSKTTVVSPTRPILVARTFAPESNQEHGQKKKKVVFADDRGMSLTHVRVMSEPSNVPPMWTVGFLSQVMRSIDQHHHMAKHEDPFVAGKGTWEITFVQPASDYVKFRQRLDKEKVSLENVMLKESENALMGTVKVCNLAFEKEVFLRFSLDSWKTHEDIQCSYQPSAVSSSAYVLYDTFGFRLPLPDDSDDDNDNGAVKEPHRHLEFCVRFDCSGAQFWDNNSGNNYRCVKKRSVDLNNNNNDANNNRNNNSGRRSKNRDVYNTRLDSWGEFACWRDSDNSSPYW